MKKAQKKLFQNKFFRKERSLIKPVQLGILLLYLLNILLYALFLKIYVKPKRWKSFPSNKSLVSITGCMTQLSTLIVFLLSSHRNLVNWLFGCSFERSLRFHKFNGLVLILATIVHAIFGFQIYKNEFKDYSGIVAFGGIVLLALISVGYLRRRNYEIFYWSHIFFAFVYLGFVFFHRKRGRLLFVSGAGLLSYLYDLIDRIHCIWRKRAKIVSYRLIGKDKQNPSAILLKIEKKNFRFHSCQWINVCFPKISKFDWHPFSIASCLDNSENNTCFSSGQYVGSKSSQEGDHREAQDLEGTSSEKETKKEKEKRKKKVNKKRKRKSQKKDEEKAKETQEGNEFTNGVLVEISSDLSSSFSFSSSSSSSSSTNLPTTNLINKPANKTNTFTIPFIVRGDWTAKVMKQAVAGNLKNQTILVDGPLGKNNQQHDQFSYFVLIAGGSGIGPIFGYLTKIFQESIKKRKVPIKKVKLVWASRNDSLVGLMNKESKIIFQNETFSSHFFWTRQKDNFKRIKNVEINTGRPDFKKLIKNFKMEAQSLNLNKIAVSICAPKSISKDVKKICTKLSSSKFYFDIMNEIIEF
ncbi:nadph oxidase 4 [Anaeramoeba flamelloides]|uniref:Nadph oxidase 4 n=1 Tax=Anaeramoeba flamelloides TaxID=1746091 RepID=A0ABQ8XGR7_9EUKA|nr:nadph oxidase 4 [Anaeramoeba flamelloides]